MRPAAPANPAGNSYPVVVTRLGSNSRDHQGARKARVRVPVRQTAGLEIRREPPIRRRGAQCALDAAVNARRHFGASLSQQRAGELLLQVHQGAIGKMPSFCLGMHFALSFVWKDGKRVTGREVARQRSQP